MYLDRSAIRKAAYYQIMQDPVLYLGAALSVQAVLELIQAIYTRMLPGMDFSGMTPEYFIRYAVPALMSQQTLLASLVRLAGYFLVSLPLTVGLMRLYIRAPYGDRSALNITFVYQGHLLPVAAAAFTTELIIGLWSILLVIPGIIKALEYTMVGCILAESPDIGAGEARELSSRMTNGVKGSIFMLLISAGFFAALAALAVSLAGGLAAAILFPFRGIISQLTSFLAATVGTAYLSAVMVQAYFALRYQYSRGAGGGHQNPYYS